MDAHKLRIFGKNGTTPEEKPCVTPSGRTDGHFSYVVLRDNKWVCAFCGRA